MTSVKRFAFRNIKTNDFVTGDDGAVLNTTKIKIAQSSLKHCLQDKADLEIVTVEIKVVS